MICFSMIRGLIFIADNIYAPENCHSAAVSTRDLIDSHCEKTQVTASPKNQSIAATSQRKGLIRQYRSQNCSPEECNHGLSTD